MSMFEVGGLIINLFRLNPDKPSITVYYVHLEDRSSINSTIHKLEYEYRCITGPQYGEYRGLKPGVYFVCDDYSKLGVSNIEYSQITINSSSYVVKYLTLKMIARKLQELNNSGKVFLPHKWFAYSQITCCDNQVIKYSKPHGLFALRQCLILRVEHIPIDDEDILFLLADSKIRRFHMLTISRIIEILSEKGLHPHEINKLLQKHYYTCVVGRNREHCIVNKVENKSVEVVIKGNRKQVILADEVVLNPHPKITRDFIESQIGEKIGEIEKIRMALSRQRPKHKIENIKDLIMRVLVNNKVFPLVLGNVEYNLELTPQTIVPLGEE